MWRADGWLTQKPEGHLLWYRVSDVGTQKVWHQRRELHQTRVFITYVLHRSVTGTKDGELILEKMADGVRQLFDNDQWLSQMLVFGKMLNVSPTDSDAVGNAFWATIGAPNKTTKMFYGLVDKGGTEDAKSSYVYDTYDTHVDKVDIDGGVEVGPKMGFPHFHLMLTLTHFSYLQFDYYRMKLYLEIIFKGIDNRHGFPKIRLGSAEDPFYGDNENPYVDLRLYPADNFMEVLHKYVRKNDVHQKVEGAVAQVDGNRLYREMQNQDDEEDEEEEEEESDSQ